MRQLASLAWKEWHELRWMLGVALGIFLGLPLIGCLEGLFAHQHVSVLAAPWVFFLGGVFAAFAAVDATCRDLNGRLEDFWRSRPIGTNRWLLVKYAVGLLIVLIACIVPLVVEIEVGGEYRIPYPAVVLLAWCPFLWVALYSLAFLCGCVMRRAAQAAMLAVAMLLLVYFLPLVLPPLKWLSITGIMDQSAAAPAVCNGSGEISAYARNVPWLPWPVVSLDPHQLWFVVGMAAISIAALLLALAAVRREWHIESGRKLIYWSMGSVLLILFGSAAFQLATNLPVLREAGLPGGKRTFAILSGGKRGVLVTGQDRSPYPDSPLTLRKLEITFGALGLGPPARPVGLTETNVWWEPNLVWLPEHPNIVYGIIDITTNGKAYFELRTVTTDPIADGPLLQSLKLWEARQEEVRPMIYARGDRLYVLGGMSEPKVGIVDISRPRTPRLISIDALGYGGRFDWPGSATMTLRLPLLPGIPPRQRLEIEVSTSQRYWACLDGDLLAGMFDRHFLVYQLTELTEKQARFRKVGQYDATLLEQVFSPWTAQIAAGHGLIYVSELSHAFGLVVPRLTVFDIRDPQRPHPVAHFAAPDDFAQAICPLPDGRVLAGGRKLYLLGKPRGMSEAAAILIGGN